MALELSAQDLQMGLAVYSADKEKVGVLRFVMTSPTAPYQVQKILVDRTDGAEGGMLVDSFHIQDRSEHALLLDLHSDEFLELPPFIESQWFVPSPNPQREGRNMGPNKNRGPRRQDRSRRYQQRPQGRNLP